MKDRYWFEHDSNAHEDTKILQLRMLYGWTGYGAFWAIVELLRNADGYAIEMSHLGAICYDLRIERDWVDSMFEIGLLAKDDDFFWSPTLLRRMTRWDESKKKRAIAGRKGGIAKAMAKQRPGKALANTEQDRTGQNNTSEESAPARASKPKRKRKTILPGDWEPRPEHRAIAIEQGVDLEAQAELFRDHWKGNGELKADWDATFRNWLRRAREFSRGRQGPTKFPQQGSIDFLRREMEDFDR